MINLRFVYIVGADEEVYFFLQERFPLQTGYIYDVLLEKIISLRKQYDLNRLLFCFKNQTLS